MEKRYYVETYYVRHRHVGYRLTRDLAWAAATDVGNRAMRKAGRSAWSEADFQAATDKFNELWPEEIPGKALSGANQLRDDLNDGNQSSGWR